MGLGKLGMSLVQKTSAWVKACGKTSILQTKPVQKVNINELKYIGNIKSDIVQITNKNKPFVITSEMAAPLHAKGMVASRLGLIRALYKDGKVNYPVDAPKDLMEKTVNYVNKLDLQIQSLPPLKEDLILYRGLIDSPFGDTNKFFRHFVNAKVGDIIIPDEAYTFLALKKSVAQRYGSSAVFNPETGNNSIFCTVKVHKGSKISFTNRYDGEGLLPRRAQYKVLEKMTDNNGNIDISLEYINT